MDKLNIECPDCGTTLGVPVSMAGRRVKCSACKAVLDVPEEPEEEWEDAEEVEEAPRPRRKKERAPPRKEPRRGGGRPGGKGRRKAGPPAKGGPPLPLILGGAGALLVIVVVVLALALSGGSEGGKGQGTEDEGGETESTTSKKGEKQARYDRLVSKAETWEQWTRAGALAKELGLANEAKAHWKEAIRQAEEAGETAEKAYTSLGYRKYTLPALDDDMKAEPELLVDLVKKDGSWLPTAEYDALKEKESGILASARAELKRRKDDPFYNRQREIQKKLDAMPGFDKLLFTVPERDRKFPYLIFEHVGRKGQNPYRSEEAKKLMESKAEALKVVYDFVFKKFLKPRNFTPPADEPMVIVSLEDRDAFEQYNKDAGMDLPPGALAYYHRKTRFIVMYNGEGENVFAKEENDSTLFHEATHQILSYFSRHRTKGEPLLSHWFNEGCAEYVGQIRERRKPDGTFDIKPAYGMGNGRLRQLAMARNPKKFAAMRRLGALGPYALSLEEMVQCVYGGQTLQRVAARWIAGGGPDPRDLSPQQRNMVLAVWGGVIYAQASSFFFFIYKGSPEKYAGKMNAYFEKEMLRRVTYRGASTFMKCFGLKDLAPLEAEWHAYIDKVTPREIKDGH